MDGTIIVCLVIAGAAIMFYIRSEKSRRAKPDYNPKELGGDIYAIAKRIIFCAKFIGIVGFISGVLMAISAFSQGGMIMLPIGILVMIASVLQTVFFMGMAHMMVKVHEM